MSVRCPHCQKELEQVYRCRRGESIAYENGKSIVRGPRNDVRHVLIQTPDVMVCEIHGMECLTWDLPFTQ